MSKGFDRIRRFGLRTVRKGGHNLTTPYLDNIHDALFEGHYNITAQIWPTLFFCCPGSLSRSRCVTEVVLSRGMRIIQRERRGGLHVSVGIDGREVEGEGDFVQVDVVDVEDRRD